MKCVSSEGVNQGLRGQGEGTQEGMRRADFGPAVSDAELAGEAGDRAVQAAVHGPGGLRAAGSLKPGCGGGGFRVGRGRGAL